MFTRVRQLVNRRFFRRDIKASVAAACLLAAWLAGPGYGNAEPQGAGRGATITMVDQASDHAEQLQAAVDPRGRIYLTWIQTNSLRQDYPRVIAYTARQDGSDDGWSVPVAINEEMSNRESTYYPRLNFDPDSNALLVWTRTAWNGASAVYARRMTAAGDLGSVIRIDRLTTLLSDSYDPRVYFNRTTGRWLAVWSQWDGWADRIMSADIDPTTIHQKANPIDAGRTDAYFPTGCINESGQALMVWRQLSPEKGHLEDSVYFSIRRADGEWTTPQDPTLDAKSARIITGTCNGARGFQIFWMQADSEGESRLWGARISPDLKLAPDRILFAREAAQKTVNPPAVLSVRADKTLLAWCAQQNNRQGLLFSELDDRSEGAPAARFIPTASGVCFNPTIAMDRHGNTLTAWVERSPTNEQFSVRAAWRLQISGPISEPLTLQTGNSGPLDPKAPKPIFLTSSNYPIHPIVLVDGLDRFWTFWTANQDGRLRVFAANLGKAHAE